MHQRPDPDEYTPAQDTFQPRDGNLRDRYLDSLQDNSSPNFEPESASSGSKFLVWLVTALLILGAFYIYRFGFAQTAFVHWYQKKNGDWVAAADSTVFLRALEPARLTGSILAKKTYRDEFSSISPTDFVLGWEEYLDPLKAKPLSIWQEDRTYYWTTPRVGDTQKIVTSTANLHLIAGDQLIGASLQKLEPGQLVKLEGQLVDVYRNEERIWKSSQEPDDIGYNSGEIIFVERLQTIR